MTSTGATIVLGSTQGAGATSGVGGAHPAGSTSGAGATPGVGSTSGAGTTSGTGPAPIAALGSTDGHILLFVIVVVVLGTGLLVSFARGLFRRPPEPSPVDSSGQPGSVIRSWIAIALAAGLLVFCAVAFMVDDTATRSTLFGGLTTSLGAAVAFYFSSKSAEQARSDVITAAGQPASKPSTFLSATPGNASVNVPYAFMFVADQTATWGVTRGRIPDGLTLNPSGSLSGTPTTTGSYVFAIAATNGAGSLVSDDVTIEVT